MAHFKHETSLLRMIHLSQILQVRNPMKNMRKCLNSTKKTLDNSSCKILLFYYFLYIKTIKTIKQQNKTNTTKQEIENNIQIQN